MVIWTRLAGFLIVGYFAMTKSFAYLGVPPLNIFIGEIVLAAFLVLKPRVALGTLVHSLLRRSPLNAVSLALLVFVAYGVWQVGRGVSNGSPFINTLKFFIFNYYALYLFMGIWIGLRAPEFLPKLVRMIAWVNGTYGLIWLVVLRHAVELHMPGSEVRLFGQPGGGAVAILGLLCFERDLRAVWPVLALNIVVTLAMQVRAEWLGLALGMLLWGFLAGRLGRVVAIGMAGLALIGVIELAGIQLPGRNAGSDVSFSEVVARVIAPIDPALAKELSPINHAGTAEWRERWWNGIWLSARSSPMLEAFGHGYGFDLLSVAPPDLQKEQAEEDERTPHSVFYYALGYTGWVGVILFGVVQFTILQLLWRSFRVSGQPAGLVLWTMGMAMACFEAGFETPYRAIPFYLLTGICIAGGLGPNGDADRETRRRPA